MRRLASLLLLLTFSACATQGYQLDPQQSVERTTKKYTLFFTNCARRPGYEYKKSAAQIIRCLRLYGYDAFHTDQKINVVVTVGQFDEPNSVEAERLARDIKSNPRLSALKPIWSTTDEAFSVVEIAMLKRTLAQDKPYGQVYVPREWERNPPGKRPARKR